MIIDIKHKSGWRERSSIGEDGEYDGKSIDWYHNGNKRFEINYLNGTYNGKYFLWDEDGNKLCEITYLNGKRQGRGISWGADGRKKVW